MATQPLVDWNSGLLDCFEDASTCCYGFWCCFCLAGTVAGRFGENRCLPLCDICPFISAAYGIPLMVPPAVLSLRTAVRNRYGIKGSICRDIAVSYFCEWCSWCQMHREIKHRHKSPTVINVHHHNVINLQPQNIMQMQNQNVMQMQNQNVMQMPPQNMMQMQPQNVMQMQPAPEMMAPGYAPQDGFVSKP